MANDDRNPDEKDTVDLVEDAEETRMDIDTIRREPINSTKVV